MGEEQRICLGVGRLTINVALAAAAAAVAAAVAAEAAATCQQAAAAAATCQHAAAAAAFSVSLVCDAKPSKKHRPGDSQQSINAVRRL